MAMNANDLGGVQGMGLKCDGLGRHGDNLPRYLNFSQEDNELDLTAASRRHGLVEMSRFI
jgi:hypothetical protein